MKDYYTNRMENIMEQLENNKEEANSLRQELCSTIYKRAKIHSTLSDLRKLLEIKYDAKDNIETQRTQFKIIKKLLDKKAFGIIDALESMGFDFDIQDKSRHLLHWFYSVVISMEDNDTTELYSYFDTFAEYVDDINIQDRHGFTLGHYAAHDEDLFFIEFLVNEYALDLSIKNKQGETVYDLAKVMYGGRSALCRGIKELMKNMED